MCFIILQLNINKISATVYHNHTFLPNLTKRHLKAHQWGRQQKLITKHHPNSIYPWLWAGWRRFVYTGADRLLLLLMLRKLNGLIFISTKGIENSWPFQWYQLIPCKSKSDFRSCLNQLGFLSKEKNDRKCKRKRSEGGNFIFSVKCILIWTEGSIQSRRAKNPDLRDSQCNYSLTLALLIPVTAETLPFASLHRKAIPLCVSLCLSISAPTWFNFMSSSNKDKKGTEHSERSSLCSSAQSQLHTTLHSLSRAISVSNWEREHITNASKGPDKPSMLTRTSNVVGRKKVTLRVRMGYQCF